MIVHHAKQTLIKEEPKHARASSGLRVKCAHNIGGRMLCTTYACNRAKSALKRGVGLYYVMGV